MKHEKKIEAEFLGVFPYGFDKTIEEVIEFHMDWIEASDRYVRYMVPNFPDYMDTLKGVARDYEPLVTTAYDELRKRWYAYAPEHSARSGLSLMGVGETEAEAIRDVKRKIR